MRLAARLKGGFYPIHPDVVRLIAARLKPEGEFSMLDPCCGKGAALQQFIELLQCPHGVGVELESNRASESGTAVQGTVIAPADFLQMRIAPKSFGMIYMNPPFDDEIGGGNRVEQSFLTKCIPLLKTGGVLVAVVPSSVVGYKFSWSPRVRYENFGMIIRNMFRHIWVLPFPEEHRHFGEVVIIATKNSAAVGQDTEPPEMHWGSWDEDVPTWNIPVSGLPERMDIGGYTDEELDRILNSSPLNSMFEAPPYAPPASPPLPLGRGHLALLLSAGQMNGVVEPEGEPPHVVRGFAGKEQYLKETVVTETEKSESVTQVYSEKIKLTIRALYPDGRIETYEQD